MFELIVFEIYLQKIDGGIFLCFQYCPIWILDLGLFLMLKLRYECTWHYRRLQRVWSIWLYCYVFFFFCIGGKGREHHMFTSITVCVEYNIYIFFCLFVNFHNLFLLNNPKEKKKEKKIEENHKIGMHY